MAIPNDVSTLSNGSTQAPAASKKKAARKNGSSAREQSASSKTKRAPARGSGPTEILFMQEPNPFREPVAPYIWIDYPLQAAVLREPAYVIRLGVGGADLVEISIDKSPWIPCRFTSGYWWYDWSTIPKGKHTLVARMRTPDGRWFKTPPRLCDYRTE